MRHLLLLITLLFFAGDVNSAEYRTNNFTVNCSDATLAKQVGDAAEFYRDKHAKEWLGQTIPKWWKPCPIQVNQGNVGAGGATSFVFDRGEVFGWNMNIQGPPQRLLDSVVPHEVLHTVFASHFRKKVPRWADEGACTYVEADAEKKNLKALAVSVAGTERQIPIRRLLVLDEYPSNVMTFYAQGFYISEHLIDQKGKREFVKFLASHYLDGWDAAFAKHYGYQTQEEAYTAAYRANSAITDTLEVKLITQVNCKPCEEAKQNVVPELLKRGIKVVYLDYSMSPVKVSGTPAFLLYKNGKRVQKLEGLQAVEQVVAGYKEPDKVKVAQGIGIGIFGASGNNKASDKPNPHKDLSPAQLQIIQREIDSRAQVNIDGTISNRMADLEKLIDARIKNAVLTIQSKLTDEQRATIGATPAQLAEIASLKDQIAIVEAGKQKQKEETDAKIADLAKKDEEVVKQVEAAKVEAETKQSTILEIAKAHAIEAVKSHVPDKVAGVASAIPGALEALSLSGPIGAALYLGARVLAARRKEDEVPAKDK